uniref:Death domain-containing protein n=1 Tax=Amphimedon queenslandica TaxID=400682 RepID=A0A1X7UI52_AMPQE
MDGKPDMPDLLDWLQELVDWQAFALFLPKMEKHFVAIIEKNRVGDIPAQKIAMYDKWLRVYPEANWGHVIKALEKAKEEELVKKVKKKLGVMELVDESTGMKKL